MGPAVVGFSSDGAELAPPVVEPEERRVGIVEERLEEKAGRENSPRNRDSAYGTPARRINYTIQT